MRWPKNSNDVHWPITSALIEQSMTIERHVLSIFSTPIDNSIKALKMVCAETILYFAHKINNPKS